MKQGTWRKVAREAISEACLIWVDATGELPRPAMPDKEKFIKHVNACYPFGQRKMHPYKIWLSEMKNLKQQLANPQPVTGGLFQEESA